MRLSESVIVFKQGQIGLSDYMDDACKFQVGHTNWAFVPSVHPDEVADGDIESIVVIYKVDDREEDDKL